MQGLQIVSCNNRFTITKKKKQLAWSTVSIQLRTKHLAYGIEMMTKYLPILVAKENYIVTFVNPILLEIPN